MIDSPNLHLEPSVSLLLHTDGITEAVRVFTAGNDMEVDQAALVLTATSAVGLTTTA
ncbi:hypothetical protein [Streptomyces sp. NBC_00306]|uniref:hypothetical protein n=1 Tax=Streptomyces sp. NBC_00306 TaxID=2975708 RepID=UPI002E2BB3CB|nr:hypothetical protein [Streptomyces sp. NBC_00306]